MDQSEGVRAQEAAPSETPKPPKENWKRFFIRGVALLLPTILTILILVKAYQFIDTYLIRYVNLGVAAVLDRFGIYEILRPDYQTHWVIRYLVLGPMRWFLDYAFGFVLSILFVYAVGLLIGTIVGRRVWHVVESRLMRVPVIRFVYPFIRQVTDFFFRDRDVDFSTVVAIEYPRKGIWSIGFLTGGGFARLDRRTAKKLVSVFIPSSPTPMTGYVVFLPAEDVVPVDISVDQAFRMIISGGVIKPDDNTPADKTLADAGAPVSSSPMLAKPDAETSTSAAKLPPEGPKAPKNA